MTPALDLDEIEARLKAATPGPYTCERQDEDDGSFYFAIHGKLYEFVVNVDEHNELGRAMANAQFIVHAPTDIAALTKRVRELEASLKAASMPKITVGNLSGDTATGNLRDSAPETKMSDECEDDINGLEAAISQIKTPEAQRRARHVIALARLGLTAQSALSEQRERDASECDFIAKITADQNLADMARHCAQAIRTQKREG